jgi:hypothetical protein
LRARLSQVARDVEIAVVAHPVVAFLDWVEGESGLSKRGPSRCDGKHVTESTALGLVPVEMPIVPKP